MNLAEPAVQFYTQRVDKPGPMVNCMFYSLMTPLRFMGLDVPRDFGMTLRLASGVPYEPHRGTSIADTKTALRKVMGWEPDSGPVHYGAMSDADLMAMLRTGLASVRVTVKCDKLPWYLKKDTVGSYDGGHAIAIARAYDDNTVYWMDPMGRPSEGYKGVRIPWADVRGAVSRNAERKVKITYGLAGSLLDYPAPETEPLMQLNGIATDQIGDIAGGAVLHPDTLRPVTYITFSEGARIVGKSDDGRFHGVLITTSKLDGANPKLLAVPVERVTNLRRLPPPEPVVVPDPELELQVTELLDQNADLQAKIDSAKAALA